MTHRLRYLQARTSLYLYTRGNYAYTVGEVVNRTAEQAYLSLALNTPPGGIYNVSNGIQSSLEATILTPSFPCKLYISHLTIHSGSSTQDVLPSTSHKLQVCRTLFLVAGSSTRSICQITRLHERIRLHRPPLPRLVHERFAFRHAAKRYSFRWRHCIHRRVEQ